MSNDSEKFYPEPIWALHLSSKQIDDGGWLSVEPNQIIDYRVNPFLPGWESRYVASIVDKRRALGLV